MLEAPRTTGTDTNNEVFPAFPYRGAELPAIQDPAVEATSKSEAVHKMTTTEPTFTKLKALLQSLGEAALPVLNPDESGEIVAGTKASDVLKFMEMLETEHHILTDANSSYLPNLRGNVYRLAEEILSKGSFPDEVVAFTADSTSHEFQRLGVILAKAITTDPIFVERLNRVKKTEDEERERKARERSERMVQIALATPHKNDTYRP